MRERDCLSVGRRCGGNSRRRVCALRPFGEAFSNLVLLHGRNGRKEDLLPVAERFCAVGFRCVIPDLPAHGESPLKTVRFGNSDFEASLPGTVLEEAKERFHFPDEPAGLWGMSMGGAFARAASLPAAPWKALVVVCSFDSLDSVVGQKVASHTSVTALLWNSLIAQVCMARGGVNPVLGATCAMGGHGGGRRCSLRMGMRIR